MYPSESSTIARMIIEDRIREANDLRRGLAFARREQPSTDRSPAVEAPQHHSRLWTLVHFRHAY